MFKAYDTGEFGRYMRSVRKSLNLTQLEVEKMSNVNVETLRRLELGKVIPKYETLEYLSIVYKQDLLSIFGIHRTSQIMYEFYNYLDEIIIRYDLEKILEIEAKFDEVLASKEMNKIIVGASHSGTYWYPKNGYMGWHTNENHSGQGRFYCNYAAENDKAFFRYQPAGTDEVVTSWDINGWTFRYFDLGDAPETRLWHCVYSNTDRISLGFRARLLRP